MGSAYLPALALSLRLTLLAVNVDLGQSVNIYHLFPRLLAIRGDSGCGMSLRVGKGLSGSIVFCATATEIRPRLRA
jgi:hypothetical protein